MSSPAPDRPAACRRVLGRFGAGLVLVVVLAMVWPIPTAVATDSVDTESVDAVGDAADRLIQRHAPLLRVVDQPEACGPGEPYRPMRPDAVFDRDGVVLRGPQNMIARPTEADLPTGPGDDWYLDLPGDALRPGCRYERLFDAWRTEPTIYGRVVTQEDRPDELAVQYWFFYLYNDWNDRHEGDWEMIQLVFFASTPEEALESEPALAMYAQHEGGEVSDWRDDVLETVDGTRPVVYVAAGSHASYFSSNRWFGKSAQSGFGCDDTRGPLIEIDPTVERLGDDDLPRWATFTGHWGERRPSFNNGPTGPITKIQWSAPLTWVETQGREGAASLPDGGTVVTDGFCAATRVGSVVLFGVLDRPTLVAVGAGVGLLALTVLLGRTRWRPIVTSPLVVRRHVGQMVTSALSIVRRRIGVFAAIGLVLVVAGVVAALLQALLLGSTEAGDFADVADRTSAWGALLALGIGAVTTVPATGLVAVLAMLAGRRAADGERIDITSIIGDLRRSWRAVVVAALLPPVLAALLVSVIGAPVAIALLLRWAVAVPAAIHHSAPLQRSARLTRGRRLRVAGVAVTTVVWCNIAPVAIGIVALLVTDLSFGAVNVIAALAGAVLLPVAAVTQLLQWADLEVRTAPTP